MRYHYEKPEKWMKTEGITHYCDHPVYEQCTLYLEPKYGWLGLAVIQQRINPDKSTWWGKIDDWLVNDIYNQKGFPEYFKKMAGMAINYKIYPTVTVRQIMWALRMKPLPKQLWETTFDHAPI